MGQVLAARRLLEPGRRITHVVYMGMGEPLANYAATVASLRTLTDARGLGFSPRRVTVSTVGLVPAIERLGREDLAGEPRHLAPRHHRRGARRG